MGADLKDTTAPQTKYKVRSPKSITGTMSLTLLAMLRVHRPESEARRMHAILDIERPPEGVRRPRIAVQDMHGRLRVQDLDRPIHLYHNEM